ncbi:MULTISPECIES: methyltransferase domain-containing protein [unclassified Streptomyces]|uniref:Protein-L-isoaspartate O-methyltransferase n=1 Tax=Streptomyces sp. NBC_00060 TaxID=2975636 RepID=A0AAU2HE23_9ACTN
MNYRARAARELDAMGAFRSPWLRPAFDAVDREMFAPAQFWTLATDEKGLHPVIDRSADFDAWQAGVWDTHNSLITQMDDGRTPADGPARGDYTSSISALDIAFEKLNQLDVEPEHRVLEIGTASGYHTALLAERVGAAQVTTIEIDPALSAWGADNLGKAGYAPYVVRGDGLAGHPESAPFDRIINTASLRRIPAAWRRQTTDGGIILTPFNTLYANGGLLKLRVHDGIASGPFVGSASYMWARSERPREPARNPDTYALTSSPIDPAQVLDGTWAQDFAIGLHVPHIAIDRQRDDDSTRRAQIRDDTGASVTVVRYTDWWEDGAVTVWGERDLWAEVVTAYTAWRTASQPHVTRYGLTVSDEGQQVWLDKPDHVLRR